jgi:hypothetical protein
MLVLALEIEDILFKSSRTEKSTSAQLQDYLKNQNWLEKHCQFTE